MCRWKTRTALAALVLLASPAAAQMITQVWIQEPNMDLLEYDRWYLTHHTREISDYYPVVRRYWSFRAWNMPPEADRFHTSRGRLTTLSYDLQEVVQWTEPAYPRQRTTPPPGGWDNWMKWIVTAWVPAVPTEDFLGAYPRPKETPYLRWLIVFRYPEGVSVEDGERWYLETHAKELARLEGLRRFVSSRALEDARVPGAGQEGGMVRVSELWFDDISSWQKAVIESPPRFTRPPWTTSDDLADFVDMASIFVGERPDFDALSGQVRIP